MTTQPPPESAEPAPVATDTQPTLCPACAGDGYTGWSWGSKDTCSECAGTGKRPATPAPAGDAEQHDKTLEARDDAASIREPSALETVQRVRVRRAKVPVASDALVLEEDAPGKMSAGDTEVSHERALRLSRMVEHQSRELARYATECEARQQQAEWEAARQLTELQQLYAAFDGSGHSPKNPREASQAIGQMAEAEREVAELGEKLGNARALAEALAEEWRQKGFLAITDELSQLRATLQGKDEAIAELQARIEVANANHKELWDSDTMRLKNVTTKLIDAERQRDELSRKLEAAGHDLDMLAHHLPSDWTNLTEHGGKVMTRLKDAMEAVRLAADERDSLNEEIVATNRKLEAAYAALAEANSRLRVASENNDLACAKLEAAEREAVKWRDLRDCDVPECMGVVTALLCSVHSPTPPDQSPPAKPLTEDDMRTIARAVVAEVAERAVTKAGGSGNASELWELAEAAKEKAGG